MILPAERIGLLRDSWALVRQGSLPLTRFLDLVIALRGERARPQAVMELAAALQFLDDYLVGDADRPRLRQVVSGLFSPLFAELGWDGKAGEPDDTRLLRAQLLGILGHIARLPSLLKEVEARLARYLREPASLDGSVADQVVRLAAQEGTAARWEDFRERSKTARTPELGLRFRYALPQFEEPALVERTLELALAPDVPPEDVLGVIGAEMANPRGRAAAWSFFKSHFAELRNKAPEFGFSGLISDAGYFCDDASRAEVAKFFAEPAHRVEAAGKRVEAAVVSIRLCGEMKKREAANLASWLRARGDRL